jgi:hypothetical protein
MRALAPEVFVFLPGADFFRSLFSRAIESRLMRALAPEVRALFGPTLPLADQKSHRISRKHGAQSQPVFCHSDGFICEHIAIPRPRGNG